LPLAYTQGFTPHPRINLASALPLGFTGEAEVVDIWLEGELPIEKVEDCLQGITPPGIQITEITVVDERAPTLQTIVTASEYVITILEDVDDLESRVERLLSQETILRTRREKNYDLRPLIQDLRPLPKDEQGRARLLAILAAREGATGRPEEVTAALGLDPVAIRVQRTRLICNQAGPAR
jgi:radical SAM-linked protein